MFKTSKTAMLRGLAVTAALLSSLPAHALPSFARQTGQDCAACHVGAFGPQLTPYGQKFKIGGYTDGEFAKWGAPLSAHAIAGFDHTSKRQAEVPSEHSRTNDNVIVQEVSAFLAGKVSEHIGTFTQVTLSGADQRVGWDGMDVRYAREVKLGKNEATVGLSLNNKPTMQDPFNTVGQWSAPYTGSDLGFGPQSAALLSGENALYGLGQNVLGLTGYAFLNNSIYVEAGGYQKLNGATLSRLGAGRDSKVDLTGISPYWRLAYTTDINHQNFSVGLIGMDSTFRPQDGDGLKDKFKDLGVDASYQFLGTRKHIATVNASYLREKQDLGYTLAEGGADSAKQTLNSYNVNTSYYYRNTYGVTLGAFGTSGNQDATLYADNSMARPNTNGFMTQIDWTPAGKESFKGPEWLNVRLALQYLAFSKYDGAATNYDNNGRNASDNNTLFFYIWSAL